jgi:hypothetical protein
MSKSTKLSPKEMLEIRLLKSQKFTHTFIARKLKRSYKMVNSYLRDPEQYVKNMKLRQPKSMLPSFSELLTAKSLIMPSHYSETNTYSPVIYPESISADSFATIGGKRKMQESSSSELVENFTLPMSSDESSTSSPFPGTADNFKPSMSYDEPSQYSTTPETSSASPPMEWISPSTNHNFQELPDSENMLQSQTTLMNSMAILQNYSDQYQEREHLWADIFDLTSAELGDSFLC